jgi:hypothetical protein
LVAGDCCKAAQHPDRGDIGAAQQPPQLRLVAVSRVILLLNDE